MGLAPQLAATLLCLLACTCTLVHGCNRALGEIVQTLSTLSEEKTPCTELTVADIFADSKNTTEKEILCRATTVLQLFYFPHKVTQCLTSHQEYDTLKSLRGLYRSIYRMAPLRNCTVNKSTQRTLKNLLEHLKTIMQKKYAQCERATF